MFPVLSTNTFINNFDKFKFTEKIWSTLNIRRRWIFYWVEACQLKTIGEIMYVSKFKMLL